MVSTGKVYLSKNDLDTQLVEYSILPINNQQSDNNAIDVTGLYNLTGCGRECFYLVNQTMRLM